MEHIRQSFEEALDETGDFEVAGETFKPHRVLATLAPEIYTRVFAEWRLQREERLMDNAEEILQLYDNENRFMQLQQAYLAESVRPFIGAGMSITSGYPGWTRFLLQICDESHVKKADLRHLINSGDYEGAAEMLYADLGPGGFNEAVQTTFGRKRDVAGTVLLLPHYFTKGPVFTTNFDTVVDRVFADCDSPGFDRVIGGAACREAPRLIADGSRLLIKMHGDCRDVAGRVLTRTEYDSAYKDEAAIDSFFLRVLYSASLLFLGCSLANDRTIQWMARIVNAHGGETLPRHYAFLELKDVEDRVQRKKELAAANIFPIWYERRDHDEAIESLLLKLRESE